MIHLNEAEHNMSQNSIREEIEILKDILFADRVKIAKLLGELEYSFEHNIQNTRKILEEVVTKKFVDLDGIEYMSELDDLIRDHEQYSSIMSNVAKLKKFQKTLQRLQLFQKELDY